MAGERLEGKDHGMGPEFLDEEGVVADAGAEIQRHGAAGRAATKATQNSFLFPGWCRFGVTRLPIALRAEDPSGGIRPQQQADAIAEDIERRSSAIPCYTPAFPEETAPQPVQA